MLYAYYASRLPGEFQVTSDEPVPLVTAHSAAADRPSFYNKLNLPKLREPFRTGAFMSQSVRSWRPQHR